MQRKENVVTASYSSVERYENGVTGELYQQYVDSTNLTLQSYREGDVLPDWKERIAKGMDATTTLIAEEQTCQAFPMSGTSVLEWRLPWWPLYYGTNKRTLSGVIARPVQMQWDIANYPFQQTDAEALAKLYQAIQETRTSFSGGVFLGELRETVRALRKPLSGFRDGLDKYLRDIRNEIRRARRAGSPRVRGTKRGLLEAISALWLETVYALRPMVSDIEDAKKALIELHSREERASVRVTKQRVNSAVQSYDDWVGTMFRVNRTIKTYHAVRVVYRAGLNIKAYDEKIGTAARWRQRFGLTLEQFVPTVWDLIPLSMVADYLSNLGDILTALSFDRRGVLWVNRTIIYESSRIEFLTPDAQYTRDYWFSPPGAHDVREFSVSPYFGSSTSTLKRVARSSTGLQIPSLIFRTPASDSLKWVNMAALAIALSSTNREVRSFLNG